MAPYLRAAAGEKQAALELYEWSARTSAAAFEIVGHLEVLLRNALDHCLRLHSREEQCGIPWFLLPTPGGDHVAEAVAVVREWLGRVSMSPFDESLPRPEAGVGSVGWFLASLRERREYWLSLGVSAVAPGAASGPTIANGALIHGLRAQGKESRHQIIAGLSFGFWSGLLGPKYEELWRDCLHKAFPYSSGKRKQVSVAVERVRRFRNRLAHHDSTINVDMPFEVRQVVELAAFIDTNAAKWIGRCSDVMAVYAQRPVRVDDTVVVPAKRVWPLYEECRAFICQAGRAFQPVERVAFYADREIKPDVPAVLHRRDNIEWTLEEAARLLESTDRFDRKIANVIRQTADTWTDGRYQVFLLSRPGDPAHRQLSGALPHAGTGRGSAFVQRQRYVSLHALETAVTTADLQPDR
ncbi:hypothetical protein KIPE111705_19655 [Kibdelosporangium persicum]